MKIGKIIRDMRKERGISAYKVAKDSGISKAYVSQLENGGNDNPSIKTLHKILKVLGVTEQEFFTKLNDGIDVAVTLIIAVSVSTCGLW